MKSSELIRKIKRAGCHFIRQGKGSHEIRFSPITKNEFVILNHLSLEVGKNLKEKNLNKAGIQ
jgi:predicted RNA binding protein YcfA (HicA-like mRNA interferase family)